MIAAAILLPLLGGAMLWPLGVRVPVTRRAPVLGVAASGVLAAALGAVAMAAAAGGTAHLTWSTQLQLGVSAEGVAGLVGVVVAGVALAVVAYASAHEDPAGLPRLLGLLVAFVGAMLLLVLAEDLLVLIIAWELVAALSWALISSAWDRSEDVRLAAHAFNATRAASVGLVLAAAAAFAGTGSFGYAGIAEMPRPLLDVVAGGVLLAAMSKSAQLPFSPWLFSAMAGPTSVSALLHSATMVAAGAYALIRLGPALEAVSWFGPLVVGIGLATALAGGVVALGEVHGKRILAASTAAQYGLMFTAVGVGAYGAAAAHLVAHALFKALLFLAVGVGMSATGTADVRRWRLGRRLPLVAAAAGVGALALAAVPPLGGAWTKEQIVAAALASAPAAGALALLAGLLSVAYAFRLHLLAFGPALGGAPPPSDFARQGTPPGRVEVVAVALLAIASAALGLVWLPGGRGVVERAVGSPIEGGPLIELLLAVVLVAIGALVALRAARRDGEVLPAALARAAAGWFGASTGARRLVVTPFLASAAAAARFDDAVLDLPPRLVGRLGASLSRALPTFDDRVVDGAVRGLVALARAGSRGISHAVELGVDGVVGAIASATARVGELSRVGDDRGVDGAVEGAASAIDAAGIQVRRLQTGLAHHYYVIAVVGLVVLLGAAAIRR